MTKWNQWKESKNKKKVSGVWGIKVFLLCGRRGGKLKEGCIFLPGISCSGDSGWCWEGERSGRALFLSPEMLLWWKGGKCRKGLGMLAPALQLSGPSSAPLQKGASELHYWLPSIFGLSPKTNVDPWGRICKSSGKFRSKEKVWIVSLSKVYKWKGLPFLFSVIMAFLKKRFTFYNIVTVILHLQLY